jgi:endonuclease YncB( thermonuclease family)
MKPAPLPAAVAFLALLVVPSVTGAREELAGPIPAEIVEVIDGDTVKLRAHIWLGQEVEISVRLAGIDTPELRGDCDAERHLALQARDYLATLLAGATVSLRDVAYDKYGGRVVAQVSDAAGHDLGTALVAAGYARLYDGGKRAAWC